MEANIVGDLFEAFVKFWESVFHAFGLIINFFLT